MTERRVRSTSDTRARKAHCTSGTNANKARKHIGQELSNT